MKMNSKEWKGRELSEDLAQYLCNENWMVWTNMPLGSVEISNVQIADVIAIPKSFAHPIVKIYEIKVTRGDFFGDIGREKYKGYFKSANQVIFAVPSNLVKVTELPDDGVGLIVRNETSWHVVRAGKRNDYKLTEELLLKLLMRGYEEHYQNYRSKERRDHEAKVYTSLKQSFHDYGVKVAGDIANASAIVKTSDELLKEIGELMGKDYKNSYDAANDLKEDVEQLIRQKRHYRLALPMAIYAMRLFDGEIFYGDPVKEIEELLKQAKKEFPNRHQVMSYKTVRSKLPTEIQA